MSTTPQNIAVSPQLPPDALSALLQSIRLRGARATSAQSERTFSRQIREQRALYLAVTPNLAVVVDGKRTDLAPGDLVLLARGDDHLLLGRGRTVWLRGEFDADGPAADHVLAVLPPVIHCAAEGMGSQWLPLSRDLLLEETGERRRPGSFIMAVRILDLLLVHALRQWAAADADAPPGWLTAAMDPHISNAVIAIHRNPAHSWSVDSLARTSLLSRSAFAARFVHLMGVSPGAYLARCRLDKAAELLRDTELAIGDVGRAAGYTSEAGFSKAFSRMFGSSPRAWRSSVRDDA